MIVKASTELRQAVFKIQDLPLPVADLSHLLHKMPEWLRSMLMDGQVLIVDRQEYYDLPAEVTAHLEIVSL